MYSLIETLMKWIEIHPISYKYLFPVDLDEVRLNQMVSDNVFPTISGLAPAITFAITLGIVRYFLHFILFKPLALYAMNLQEIPFLSQPEIDKAFPMHLKTLDRSKIKSFATQSNKSLSSVNKYLITRRKSHLIQKKIVKFVEALWRWIFYVSFVSVGYVTLFLPEPAEWIKDTSLNWTSWPFQQITPALSLYYQIELGCYLHQLMWTEVSRSDAFEMIVHHFATIILVALSFLTNFTRVGTSILFLHDISDVFLESAKVFNYTSKAKPRTTRKNELLASSSSSSTEINSKNNKTKKQQQQSSSSSSSRSQEKIMNYSKILCDVLFTLFAITFFLTRLVIFPRYILYTVLYESLMMVGKGTPWVGWGIFSVLLIVLQCLHVFWFYLIGRMIVRLLTTGIEKDERSDDEDDGEEEEDDEEEEEDEKEEKGKGEEKSKITKKNQ